MSEPRDIQLSAPGLASDPYWRGEDGRNCAPTLSMNHPQRRGVSSRNLVGAPREGDVHISGGTVHTANTINFTSVQHYAEPPASTQVPSAVQDPTAKLRAMTNTSLWISPQDISFKRTPKTGQIFLSGEKFTGWVRVPGSVLWASGDPGAGKTFLASAVYDAICAEVVRSPNDACTIIYLKHNDQWTTWDIISCIILDLVESNPLPAALDAIQHTLTGKGHSNSKPSHPDLVTLLRTIVKLYGRCYVLIDGLDEMKAEIQAELMRTIAELEANVFLTSRVLKLVQDKLAEIAPVKPVFITFAAQAEDLELFINETIDRTPTLWGLLDELFPKEWLIQKIQKNAHGMFLHAALQMEALRHCIDQQELIDMLDQLPPGIEALYADTVKRIERQPPGHVSRAKTALIWLVHANGALTIDDLRCATAAFAPDYRVEPKRQLTEDNLLAICCGLATVDPKTRQVRLIHATARDALRSILQNECSKPHTMIAIACITRLAEFGFPRSTDWHLYHLEGCYSWGPLLRYAHRTVQHHVRKGVQEDPALLSRVDQFVRQCTSFPYQDPAGSTDVHGLSSLHVATLFNQKSIVAKLLEDDNADVNVKTRHSSGGLSALAVASSEGFDDLTKYFLTLSRIDVNGGDLTPLMCAAIHGREAVIKQILSHFGGNTYRDGLAQWKKEVNRSGRSRTTALTLAAWKGHVEVVKLLLAWDGIDVNVEDKHGWTPLAWASQEGHVEVVKLLLRASCIDINQQATGGSSPLYTASRNGHDEVVKLLLNAPGIDINQSRITGESPLYTASRQGHIEVVKLLLNFPGIDINQGTTNGTTPLHAACQNGHFEVVKLFLNFSSINPNPSTESGITPLHAACKNGKIEIVKLLLDFPCTNANHSTKSGTTPLYVASHKGHVELVKLLLSLGGININQRTTYGSTPLHAASQNGHIEIVKLLLDAPGIDVNQGATGGDTPLSAASRRGHVDVVKLLLNVPGIDIHQSTESGTTPLHAACQKGRFKVVKLLLDFPDINVNQTTKDGTTPLHDACRNSNIEAVELLLSAPALDVNQTTQSGATALYTAAYFGHVEAVKLLLNARGINTNQCTADGTSPLYAASANGHVAVVKLLLNVQGIDVNRSRTDGDSPLYIASRNGQIEVLKLLLKAPGIDVNRSRTNGITPLYVAAEKGHVEVVKVFLKVPGIDVNRCQSRHISPLIIGAYKGHVEVVKTLLNFPGINIAHKDLDEDTALAVASRKGHDEITRLLSAALGPVPVPHAPTLPSASSSAPAHGGPLLLPPPESTTSQLGIIQDNTAQKRGRSGSVDGDDPPLKRRAL